MSGPIGYAAPDGFNEIRVSPKNPLPVAIVDDSTSDASGVPTEPVALARAQLEATQLTNTLLAQILLTLAEMGNGTVAEASAATDLLASSPLN